MWPRLTLVYQHFVYYIGRVLRDTKKSFGKVKIWYIYTLCTTRNLRHIINTKKGPEHMQAFVESSETVSLFKEVALNQNINKDGKYF